MQATSSRRSRSPRRQPDVALGALIRQRRKAAGVSQSALALIVGVSFQQVQKYELGSNRVAFSRLVEVARALDCSILELIADLETIGPGDRIALQRAAMVEQSTAASHSLAQEARTLEGLTHGFQVDSRGGQTLDRLPQPRSGSRARPQTSGPARRHRARAGGHQGAGRSPSPAPWTRSGPFWRLGIRPSCSMSAGDVGLAYSNRFTPLAPRWPRSIRS